MEERRWSRWVDRLIAAAVLFAGTVEIWAPLDSREGDGNVWVSTAQVVGIAGLLLLRRTRPLPAATAVFGLFVGLHLTGLVHLLFFGQFVPLVLMTFAAARYGKGRTPWAGGVVVAATMLTGDLLIPLLQQPGEILFHWGVLTGAYALGHWQRAMTLREAAARHRAVAAEVEAAEKAATAVLEERTRIARELHDVVAHAVSVIVVQAGAAQLVCDEPEEVSRSLESIRRIGADALGEMRRLVTMLRDPDEAALRAPQPGLAALEQLVADARGGGLPVSLEVSGAPRDLPAGVDLTAYRIVQEALTNALQHADGVSAVTVTVGFTGGGLRLAVRDDGVGMPGTAGSGHGLIGMRERVALYRGSLHTEALPGRGFLVEATLPLESA